MRICFVLLQRLRDRSVWLAMLPCVYATIASAQVQTAPILEPRGQEEAAPAVAKGAAAITQVRHKCSTDFVVNADALFAPHRWTLNHDAAQTLDALGPMITQAGKHPAQIAAYTGAAESDAENRDVSQRRALTVRTWLVNHHFVPEGTPIEAPGQEPGDSSSPRKNEHHPDNGTVQVFIESCH